MKILQLSTDDGNGGAGIAARRLHLTLRDAGHESHLLVKDVSAHAPATQSIRTDLPSRFREDTREILDQGLLRFYPHRRPDYFSPGFFAANLNHYLERLKPDVVHLHWGLRAFVSANTLSKISQPVVWTLHDMWPITGGCHYSSDCLRFRNGCGECPALGSHAAWDLSSRAWQIKLKSYRRKSLRLICPSEWLAGLVRQSPLLSHAPLTVLPNPIDARVFRPMDRVTARQCLNLPLDLPLVLCGAASQAEPRKGFDLLLAALKFYGEHTASPDIILATFGPSQNLPLGTSKKIRVIHLGPLRDEATLNLLYNSADALVVPSREENLSMALSEALCCGTPGLAFEVGGNAELINHQRNGFLAKPFAPENLAHGLSWILENSALLSKDAIAREAHAFMSAEVLMERFINLYREAEMSPANATVSAPRDAQRSLS